LYNAVLLSELEVTQRSNHSMIVTYVSPSMDAAIAGDYKDLKFENNTETPIYIEGYISGNDLYFNIFGQETRPANRIISYESEIISEEDPGTQFVATADPVGSLVRTQSKHMGYVARLWKIVTVDGVEESREVWNSSTYQSSPQIVNVGTASEDANITAAINAAIATGDEGTVYTAVLPYNGQVGTILNPPAAPAETVTTEGQPAETTQEQPAETTQEQPAETTQEQPAETQEQPAETQEQTGENAQ
jgi:hypothetical protein